MNDKSKTPEILASEDKDLIRTMLALPTEYKILARGIILGLSISEWPEPQSIVQPRA